MPATDLSRSKPTSQTAAGGVRNCQPCEAPVQKRLCHRQGPLHRRPHRQPEQRGVRRDQGAINGAPNPYYSTSESPSRSRAWRTPSSPLHHRRCHPLSHPWVCTASLPSRPRSPLPRPRHLVLNEILLRPSDQCSDIITRRSVEPASNSLDRGRTRAHEACPSG